MRWQIEIVLCNLIHGSPRSTDLGMRLSTRSSICVKRHLSTGTMLCSQTRTINCSRLAMTRSPCHAMLPSGKGDHYHEQSQRPGGFLWCKSARLGLPSDERSDGSHQGYRIASCTTSQAPWFEVSHFQVSFFRDHKSITNLKCISCRA
jgi:hypothetical protein